MTKRAFALVLLGGAAILAATYALPPEEPILPKLSREQCREAAARFLGVAANELAGGGNAAVWEMPTAARPPRYGFRLAYPPEVDVDEALRLAGRALVVVDGWSGEVVTAEYEGRRYEIGDKHLDEKEARAIAATYLEHHWVHWPRARFLSATEPVRFPPASGSARAPEQSLRWVVEENGIRTGNADVTLNLSTGEVIGYAQHYYSAEGLGPARLNREQAVGRGLAWLAAGRWGAAHSTEAYLATRWRNGRVQLVWSVWLRVSTQPVGPGGSPAPQYGVTLDAYTGEVLSEVIPG